MVDWCISQDIKGDFHLSLDRTLALKPEPLWTWTDHSQAVMLSGSPAPLGSPVWVQRPAILAFESSQPRHQTCASITL